MGYQGGAVEAAQQKRAALPILDIPRHHRECGCVGWIVDTSTVLALRQGKEQTLCLTSSRGLGLVRV